MTRHKFSHIKWSKITYPFKEAAWDPKRLAFFFLFLKVILALLNFALVSSYVVFNTVTIVTICGVAVPNDVDVPAKEEI